MKFLNGELVDCELHISWRSGVGVIIILMNNLGNENDVVNTWSYATATSIEWHNETWYIEECCYTILSYDDSHLWCCGCIPSHKLMILKLHCSILHIDDELMLLDAYGVDHIWCMIVSNDYHDIF